MATKKRTKRRVKSACTLAGRNLVRGKKKSAKRKPVRAGASTLASRTCCKKKAGSKTKCAKGRKKGTTVRRKRK